MTRETLSFIVFFALLAMVFKFGGSDWRFHQREYRRGAYESSRQAWQQGKPGKAAIPPDSLVSRLEALDIGARLERLADSLAVLRSELDGYEELLLAVRDAVAGMEDEYGEQSGEYFGAVRDFRRLDGVTSGLSAEVDSLRQGIKAAELVERGGQSGAPGRINRLNPTLVPVSEACITCHLPLNGQGRVMLYPGNEENVEYPAVMAAHDYKSYGCTVCHAGVAAALDFRPAHGADHMLRPFRPGKLALRSCGICHAERSPLSSPAVAFNWPDDCAACHGADNLSTLADSSGNGEFELPLAEQAVRNWLLRHWAEKSGVVPDRMEFENALAMVLSGDVRRIASEQDPDSSDARQAEGVENMTAGEVATCPTCGRKFTIGNGGRPAVCPLDGTLLVPLGSKR